MIAKIRAVLVRSYFAGLRTIWLCLPSGVRGRRLARAFGRYMHKTVCRHSDRRQNHSTFFFRNRPEFELICSLLTQKPSGSRIDISVIGCSNGAEVYSLVFAIRSSRPDLKINLQAVDISQPILDAAEQGVYSHFGIPMSTMSEIEQPPKTAASPHQRISMFVRMNPQEMNAMFEMSRGQFQVRPSLKEGIQWVQADAADLGLATVLGLQDLVIANRFLCHMKPALAEACLRNIARSVKPGGFLGVSGIDLDVRTKVALDLKWNPVMEKIVEVHEGDPSLTESWPYSYWGVEPFSTSVPDWSIRYASFFQIGSAGTQEQVHGQFSDSFVNPNNGSVHRRSISATCELSGTASNV